MGARKKKKGEPASSKSSGGGRLIRPPSASGVRVAGRQHHFKVELPLVPSEVVTSGPTGFFGSQDGRRERERERERETT